MFWLLSLITLLTSTTFAAPGDVGPSKLEVSISGGKKYVQFGTRLSAFRPVADSTLVRPSYPDAEQFIDLKNISNELVTIKEVKVWIPNVTAILLNTVLQPGEEARLLLTYSPTLPTNKNATTEYFSTQNALLIFTDDTEDPLIPIELRGGSTYNADVSYDGVVNFGDLGVLNTSIGKDSTSPDWDPTTDVNGDGASNFTDLGGLNNEMYRKLPVLSDERIVRVAAIKTSQGYPDVIAKIDSLLSEKTDLDLILTPEYSFFSLGPVDMECTNLCTVQSVGTANSDLLVSVITSLQQKAADHKVNIVLGTLIAGVKVDEQFIYDNTTLVISNTGQIVAHHRKMEFPEQYAPEVCKRGFPGFSQTECAKYEQPSIDSAYPVVLTTQSGEYFTTFALICAELQSYYPHALFPNYKDFYHYHSGEVILIERLRDTRVDILAHALSSGDILTDTLTECVQSGKDLATFPCSLAKSQTKEWYVDQWKDHFGVLRDTSAILSSDIAGSKVGVLNLSFTPVPGYFLRPDALIANINLPRQP